jgi:hypothetical protein
MDLIGQELTRALLSTHENRGSYCSAFYTAIWVDVKSLSTPRPGGRRAQVPARARPQTRLASHAIRQK